ncbi:MAG: hypothetical protein OEM46_02060 [Ignavibacteria bacterium]|nr:hypothetical protein [Ignavibacteria bacterium]
MNLSDKYFLDKVEDYTSNPLQRKDDLTKIIHLVRGNGKEDEFEELTFTAKYICGMMRVLKNAPGIPEVSSTDHVKNDLNENMKKGIEQLKEIISVGDVSHREYFETTYFTLSPQNFANLSQLFSDLEAVKKYINHLKRQS